MNYTTKREAESILARRRLQDGKGVARLEAYKCPWCPAWHLGHRVKRERKGPVVRSRTPRAVVLRAYLADARRQAATKAGVSREVRAAMVRAEVELAVLDRQAADRKERQ